VRRLPAGARRTKWHQGIRADDYSAERRHRDGSRTTGLQFWACHSITAEAMAKALQQSAIKPR
jgi:hypothetical protein